MKVKTVKFRCARSLKQAIQLSPVIRDEDKVYKENRLPSGERKNRIVKYLKKHVSITTKETKLLNECTKETALKDLKELMEENKILSVGNGRSSLYIRAYE
ncbi:MAG: DeoR family transcriptional regulator [Tannerellaceae bacterium]|nr:DeoR family transcriptional regulator [Tannerellaceae bacterium]